MVTLEPKKTVEQRLDAIERKIMSNEKKKLKRKDIILQKNIAYVLKQLENNALRTTYE